MTLTAREWLILALSLLPIPFAIGWLRLAAVLKARRGRPDR